MMPHETLESHRDTIPSARSPRRQRKGHPSATGPQSMGISSPGRVPQQSFEPGLSQKSKSASSSSRTGPQTPPMLSGRSSSHLAAQTSPLTSGSTLSRGLLSTLPKCWERTTPLMSRPSSPKTWGPLPDLCSSPQVVQRHQVAWRLGHFLWEDHPNDLIRPAQQALRV